MDIPSGYCVIEVGPEEHRTDKAVLCDVEGDETWIPLSVMRDGWTGSEELVVATWFAKKQGWDTSEDAPEP